MSQEHDKVKQRRKQAKKVTDKIAEGLDRVQQSGIIESGKNLVKSVGRLLDDGTEKKEQ